MTMGRLFIKVRYSEDSGQSKILWGAVILRHRTPETGLIGPGAAGAEEKLFVFS